MSLATILNDIAPVKQAHNPYKGNKNLPQPYNPRVKKGTEPLTPDQEEVARNMHLDAEDYREFRDVIEGESLTQEEVNMKLGEDVEAEYIDPSYVPDLGDKFPKQEDQKEVPAFGVDPLSNENDINGEEE